MPRRIAVVVLMVSALVASPACTKAGRVGAGGVGLALFAYGTVAVQEAQESGASTWTGQRIIQGIGLSLLLVALLTKTTPRDVWGDNCDNMWLAETPSDDFLVPPQLVAEW